MPPMTNVTIKPSVNSIGTENCTRPRYIVNNQPKIVTAVGTAMSGATLPKKAFTSALAPMVKKWCSQTINESTVMTAVA